MTWRDRMSGYDTETTGTDPETARIVSAALVTTHDPRPASWLIRQAEPIPAEATAVHGITTEHANEHGMDATEALLSIKYKLQWVWATGAALVAYNAAYDLTVLDRELRRHGLGALEIGGLVVDPLVMVRGVSYTRKGSSRLADVCQLVGVPLGDDAHGAVADALAATRLAWKLALMPTVRGVRFINMDADALMDWQADAYQTQRDQLNARRLGNGLAPYPTGGTWPLAVLEESIA